MLWSARANEVARSVKQYYLQHSKFLPGVYYPADTWHQSDSDQRRRNLRNLFPLQHYWWCVHFIDCAIDQALRSGQRADRQLVRKLIVTLYLRNGGTVVNDYYDDMAWLGLTIQRAEKFLGLRFPQMRRVIQAELSKSWSPQYGGGQKWCIRDYFFNAPTNGPAGIFALRNGDITQTEQISSWVNSHLYDPGTGLIMDGIHSRMDSSGNYILQDLETTLYAYNQGTIAAVEWGLFHLGLNRVGVYDRLEIVAGIIAGVKRDLCTAEGVICGQGEGDAGLFPGILTRYLAEIVCGEVWTISSRGYSVRQKEIDDIQCSARAIVMNSADAVYQGAFQGEYGLRFSSDWSREAGSDCSTDMSVQVGAWLAVEAAARIERKFNMS